MAFDGGTMCGTDKKMKNMHGKDCSCSKCKQKKMENGAKMVHEKERRRRLGFSQVK